jgi:hypothetical protein
MAGITARIARSRRAFAVAVPLSLVLSLLAWAPPASADAFPSTAADTVRVRAADLAAGRAGLSVSDDGSIRAARTATTAETTVCSDIWATGVGVTWVQRGAGDVTGSLRVGPDAGSLGAPVQVEAEGDHAPDPGTPEDRPGRAATGFVWTGGNRCLALSLEVPAGATVKQVDVVFVNPSGSAAGPGTAPRQPAVTATEVSEASTGGPARPKMTYRAQWGADDALNNCDPYYAPELKMAFVHHTAGTNDYAMADVDDILRGIQYFHTQVQGWCDIAYNFLVDRFGRIYVGRKGGPSLPTVPGATQGFNTGSTAVSAIGNYEEVAVPGVVVDAIERVLAWRLDVAHLPAAGWATMVSGGGDNNRYPAGTKVTMSLISGHRRTGYTACPGDNLNVLLPQIRKAVAAMGTPKVYRPTADRTSVTPNADTVTFTATGSEALDWVVTIVDGTGVTVKTLKQGGTAEMTIGWKGKDRRFQPLLPGDYTVFVNATDPSGKSARGAALTITVNPVPPPA